MRIASVGVASLLGLGAIVAGQTPAPQAPDRPTFRAGVRLATFDVIVADEKGNHVTTLTASDFEVVERGKRQPVRQAVYVDALKGEGAAVSATGAGKATLPAATGIPGQPGLAAPGRTRRVLAIVVDDLNSDLPALVRTREMLTWYLDTQVAPGDLVAILRASSGSGALQQFTSDRRLLAAAIARVRWRPRAQPFIEGESWSAEEEEFLREQSVDDAMGVLQYAVRGVAALPGRKAIVFVSERGVLLFARRSSVVPPGVQHAIDSANRAGVAIYTINPGGLASQQLRAEDDPFAARRLAASLGTATPGGRQPPDPAIDVRAALPAVPNVSGTGAIMKQQIIRGFDYGLEYLAEQTGGFAVINTNDLAGGLGRIIGDTRGYYLIGFDTAIAPGARLDPNDVRIRTTRKGLQVRARRAPFGPADAEAKPEATPADPLVTAILSPFSTGGIDVRLTSLFGHDATDGPYVRSLVAIDPAGLTLTTGDAGQHEGDLTLLALAVDGKGEIARQTLETVAVRLDAEAYARAQKGGLRYGLRIPLKNAGGYQIRVAVRDERSKTIGTAAEFVEVPRVGKDRLALSGIALSAAGSPGAPLATTFAPGGAIEYRCTVYDGRTSRDRALATRATVLRDGTAVHDSPPAPIAGAAKDAAAIAPVAFRGTLTLGSDLMPGAYTLQISVAENGSGKPAPATQWVDFEVR